MPSQYIYYLFWLVFSAYFSSVADAAQGDREGRDVCLAAFAELNQIIPPDADNTDPNVQVVKMISDPRICTCTDERLRRSGKTLLRNTEDDAIRLLRATTGCLAEHVNSRFPEICPALYRNLLPQIGYTNITEQSVRETCGCVSTELANTFTDENVFMHRWQSAKQEAAKSFDAASGQRTAEKIEVPPDPLVVALAKAKSCADAATRAAPR